MSIFGIRSTIIDGDALDPGPCDLIAQTGQLKVGERVPEGWRVLTGNSQTSVVARVAYRYEIETAADRIHDATVQVETTARDLLKEIDRIGLSGAAVGERNALEGALAQLDRAREG